MRCRAIERHGIFVDDPRAPLSGGITPDPLDADQQPLLKIDEQIDMHDGPEQPGEAPLQLPGAEVEDGCIPTNDGRIAAIAEAEWTRRIAS